MRVLLIEDEEKVASFIKKGLEQNAYTVDWAPTGEEGLEFARAAEYHAIILDLMLPRNPAQVFTRTALLESVWGYDFDSGSNVLDVYMNFLRKKVDAGFDKKLLHTVRGVGYVLREESPAP